MRSLTASSAHHRDAEVHTGDQGDAHRRVGRHVVLHGETLAEAAAHAKRWRRSADWYSCIRTTMPG